MLFRIKYLLLWIYLILCIKGKCDYLEHDFKKVNVLNLDLSIILSFFLTLLVHVHLHSDFCIAVSKYIMFHL